MATTPRPWLAGIVCRRCALGKLDLMPAINRPLATRLSPPAALRPCRRCLRAKFRARDKVLRHLDPSRRACRKIKLGSKAQRLTNQRLTTKDPSSRDTSSRDTRARRNFLKRDQGRGKAQRPAALLRACRPLCRPSVEDKDRSKARAQEQSFAAATQLGLAGLSGV